MTEKNREAALIVSACGFLFGLSALLYRFSPWLFAYGFVVGSYLGFAALPFFDRHKWKPQPGVCSLLAAVTAAIGCVLLEASPLAFAISVSVAALAGYLAPWWAPHVSA